MFAIVLFIAGAILGSFATALAYRLPRGENWVTERSRCPACGAQIRARDNVPILSWLLLRGQCRDCCEPISARYPLAELTLAALFAATDLILEDQEWWILVSGLVLCFVLVVITLTDLDQRIIPNKVVLAGSIVAVALVAVGDPDSLVEHGASAAIAGGLMFLIALAYPRGMGMGDAKLVAMIGLFIGRAVAPATLIGSAARKQAIPFGPFLAVGGVIGLWFGDDMVQWYLDEFFPAE